MENKSINSFVYKVLKSISEITMHNETACFANLHFVRVKHLEQIEIFQNTPNEI